MKEVCRLLGIKQKSTTLYHLICNGLVERLHATLKTCLRRLCSEHPRQWHRYINPLLFAYREVPQESTHFAPFELRYRRTVRGPMHILRELLTKDIEEPDVKSSYEYVLNLRRHTQDSS
ncbi:gypsy retrotransposon integrase-like protein 1 [Plakobranchus ocellatus]|uniref:Gypsy retrotransposon integrase-like protein 1 n=1 Tax=Plakobranchus ocellatus TaxID=259542 RepID=A0AAV3ZS16_9GAST|nr:gypsy retrotransposon integrase-like protein 1 [Plakobranchus ocellatus]